MIFEFELVENFESVEGDGDFGIGVVGVVNDIGDVWIVWGESFEDVVVIVEIECDGIGHVFFLLYYRSTLHCFRNNVHVYCQKKCGRSRIFLSVHLMVRSNQIHRFLKVSLGSFNKDLRLEGIIDSNDDDDILH